MKRANRPIPALTALLDALEQELLAASADEMRGSLSDSGRARDAICPEIRSVLNEAQIESDAGSGEVVPFILRTGSHLCRH